MVQISELPLDQGGQAGQNYKASLLRPQPLDPAESHGRDLGRTFLETCLVKPEHPAAGLDSTRPALTIW